MAPPWARCCWINGGCAGAGGKEVTYVGPDLWELELAWATTVHKAQGSESRAVVVARAPAPPPPAPPPPPGAARPG